MGSLYMMEQNKYIMIDKNSIEEELLVLRCQRGNKVAFEALIRRREKALLYYIMRMVMDDQEALEILQEVWLKVIVNIKYLREPKCLSKWLYSIARSQVIKHYKRKHKWQEKKEYKNLDEISGNDKDLGLEDVDLIHYGLNQIGLKFREILTLFYLQELSLEEIASVLGVPLGTAKSRLYHARKVIRKAVGMEK